MPAGCGVFRGGGPWARAELTSRTWTPRKVTFGLMPSRTAARLEGVRPCPTLQPLAGAPASEPPSPQGQSRVASADPDPGTARPTS